MSQEYMPLRKEFGIFLFGWTGAITITVAMYYAVHSYQSVWDIASDWAIGMLIGIGAFAAFCVICMGLLTITEIVNDIRSIFRKMVKSIRQFISSW